MGISKLSCCWGGTVEILFFCCERPKLLDLLLKLLSLFKNGFVALSLWKSNDFFPSFYFFYPFSVDFSCFISYPLLLKVGLICSSQVLLFLDHLNKSFSCSSRGMRAQKALGSISRQVKNIFVVFGWFLWCI